jgi:hypothetical protein
VLLLHQQGYEIGRYISLERLIERTKESYYDTLYHASQGWHQDKHDPMPCIEYLLSTLLGAYREFETRIGRLATGHGTKTDIVLTDIDQMIGSFSISNSKPPARASAATGSKLCSTSSRRRPAQALRPGAQRPLAQGGAGCFEEMAYKQPKTTPFFQVSPHFRQDGRHVPVRQFVR